LVGERLIFICEKSINFIQINLTNMLTKELVDSQIEKLPKEFSVDELFERLIVVDKIEKGINDIKNGNFFTEEEMDIEFKKWFEE
jgi:hypothetical protein